MIEISQIRTPCGADPTLLMDARIRKILRLRTDVPFRWTISRHSVDARRKPELLDVWSVRVVIPDPKGNPDRALEQRVLLRVHDRNVRDYEEVPYVFPRPAADARRLRERPVVVGFGPAGIFCALKLAQAGYRPIVLERGQCMEKRVASVASFWDGGPLNPESNIQFGEGGAGTFSDGKLTSNVKDTCGRVTEVLRTLAQAGAPEDILYEQLPHVGTDRLRGVICRLREEIQRLGGEIRFETKMTGLRRCGGRITGVRCRTCGGTEELLPCEVLVLAPGHSARDTVRMLLSQGVPMTAKPFAVGLRVSHPQRMIDAAQYGISDPEELRRLHLPPAGYKLTGKGPDGRGVYSFCMCPGGWVVNASSEPGRLSVNGMSDYARDAARANSAIVMTVSAQDPLYGGSAAAPDSPGTGAGGEADTVLAGMRFQEELEEKAFRLSGGAVPVQRLSSFERGVVDEEIPSSDALCIRGVSAPGALHTLLPRPLTEDFLGGMHAFGQRIQGFDGPQTFVIGLESRTSSPVRILRNEAGESILEGLYPCGEGAGYAGGIVSAAADGLRIAEQIGRRYRPG